MIWFILIAINIVSIVMLLGTTKYLNYIDRKAQKHFEMTRLAVQYLEKTKDNKHYLNHGHE